MINEERGYRTKINNMIPKEAKYIIYNFIKYGNYETYLVGGCVRDIILGRTPHDWDICTSATPEEMLYFINTLNKIEYQKEIDAKKHGVEYKPVFIKSIPTGLQHGTITIVVNGHPFEVTTFRNDGKYSDNRRPDEVTFTKNLIEDLRRRDFTINAIAYSIFQGFIDPFRGIQDIKKKIIRCVGTPEERFGEDALRILRAVRFACQLNFDIHPSIGWCIGHTDIKNNLHNISVERINSEFCKMIVCDNFYDRLAKHYSLFTLFIPELNNMIGFQQNNPYHKYDVFLHTYHALKECDSNDLIIKLAVLFHDIGKPHCYQDDEDGTRHFRGHGKVSSEMANEIMRRLKFDNDTREKVVELVHYHDATFEVGKKYVRRWLNILGEEQFRRLLEVRKADIKAQSGLKEEERLTKVKTIIILLDEVLEENECFSLKDLAINGKDLMQLGIPEGKMIGKILNQLLSLVIDGTVKNEKHTLFEVVNLMFTSDPSLYNLLRSKLKK